MKGRVVSGRGVCYTLHHPTNRNAADGASIRRGNRLKKRVQIVKCLVSNHDGKFVQHTARRSQ